MNAFTPTARGFPSTRGSASATDLETVVRLVAPSSHLQRVNLHALHRGRGERVLRQAETRRLQRILVSYVAGVSAMHGVVAVRWGRGDDEWVVETITDGWDTARNRRIRGLARLVRETRLRRGPAVDFRIVSAASLGNTPRWSEGWSVVRLGSQDGS